MILVGNTSCYFNQSYAIQFFQGVDELFSASCHSKYYSLFVLILHVYNAIVIGVIIITSHIPSSIKYSECAFSKWSGVE